MRKPSHSGGGPGGGWRCGTHFWGPRTCDGRTRFGLPPPGLPVPGDPRPLRRYCRAPVPAVRLSPHPWGRFRVGACGGDRGFGACQDQLGDKPLACYLLPLLACVSLVSALGGRGDWFGFSSRPGSLCGSRAWLARPRRGCLAAPRSFRRSVRFCILVALCRGPFPGRLPRPRRSFDFVTVYSHPPFSLCRVAGGPCLPQPWPGWQSGLRSGRRVWTLRGRLQGAEDLSGCPPGLNRPGGGEGVGG